MSLPMYKTPNSAAGTGNTAYRYTILLGYNNMLSMTIPFTAALAPKAGGELAFRTSLIQGAAPTAENK